MSTSAKIPSTSEKECSPQPYLSTRSEGKTLGRGLIQELLSWDIQKSGKMYLPKSSSVACSTCRFFILSLYLEHLPFVKTYSRVKIMFFER